MMPVKKVWNYSWNIFLSLLEVWAMLQPDRMRGLVGAVSNAMNVWNTQFAST
jgi:hypothetical protein